MVTCGLGDDEPREQLLAVKNMLPLHPRSDVYTRTDLPDVGTVEAWTDITDVSGQLVSFRATFVFQPDGAVLTSDSTLRFRERDQVTESYSSAGSSPGSARKRAG